MKLAEAARETALLVESDRLRTALLNSISHELRTPLSGIIGSVSTLMEAGDLYNEQTRRELLETIQEGAVRMERVVANLLDTARLESGMLQLKTDWCDIEDIVGAALRRIGDMAHQLTVEIPNDLDLIRADCILLEQVLVNLVDNAIKYSPPASAIAITAAQENGSMQVSVLDNGPGIPSEDLSRIFDKFYRIRQPKQMSGTGLGLSICKGIIEAHGGRIWAQNRSGGGTAFHFIIPVRGDGAIIPPKAGRLI
ncbi:MAG TPA: ATP-binding protein [Methylomusa anaerophila]|uniref:histidine kinase n=1 Tax=Methylomusa anaerophila TaxID=1930071 RepID=A0A348AMN0_9FIRM|nr:ATP-binding protein [Methylomusa anaerophila]BBB92328.1 sensor protein KdpD [Methylomusa anaerophila]HML90032.1 ATP-binding protein [Methylomusa anaerophila]